MAEIITQLTTTIYLVRTVEVTGDLFEALCNSRTETSTTRLLNYSSARFLSITNAIRRVLDTWPLLEEWSAERARKAVRDKTRPPVFPLAGREKDLSHVLSVLVPVAELKRTCQADAPHQVDVLMMLYKLRLNDLNNEKPVRHYLSTDTNPHWIEPNELTPLAKSTRRLLREMRLMNDSAAANTTTPKWQKLPVKVLFAVPGSSCQIERDFSVSGSMVTSQRTSLSQHNIDMATFLNRNGEFVDLLQCEAIKRGKRREHTPSCFTYPLDLDWDIEEDFSDEILAGFMSNTSFSLYEEGKENS
ncbi:unnamed protein product [Phytophthora fragariaefolia]|uniref:Unnamed protein product n=1 Tax=Phytophthora fragariaefolia TaxID=1490495 RepID=A0A9W6XEI2_9STRA|nr:unnamed protein product [Phytophthora fragariaefolia]